MISTLLDIDARRASQMRYATSGRSTLAAGAAAEQRIHMSQSSAAGITVNPPTSSTSARSHSTDDPPPGMALPRSNVVRIDRGSGAG